jgi:hypothetical protein
MPLPPLVFTHVHKCSGTSLRQMLYRKLVPLFGRRRMHVPEITCSPFDNLPMLAERGEPFPSDLMLLADHTPFGLYDDRVLAPGRPFRITLLREPLDRFESYYHFCAGQGFIPEEWVRYVDDLAAMPEPMFIELCRFFEDDSGLACWFDPRRRDPDTALSNLLGYDLVGRYDDLEGFCHRFNRRNPYGLTFQPNEVLHLNHTPRPSRMTARQRDLARELLAGEHRMWSSPALRRILDGETLSNKHR